MLLMLFICVLYSLPVSIMIHMFKQSLSIQDIFVKVSSRISLIEFMTMIVIVFRNAFLEEVFFRSYLLNILLRYMSSTKANLVQAVIFSLFHFDSVGKQSISSKYYFVHWFISGVLYGWSKQLSESLIVSTSFHTLHNVKVYFLPIITA